MTSPSSPRVLPLGKSRKFAECSVCSKPSHTLWLPPGAMSGMGWYGGQQHLSIFRKVSSGSGHWTVMNPGGHLCRLHADRAPVLFTFFFSLPRGLPPSWDVAVFFLTSSLFLTGVHNHQSFAEFGAQGCSFFFFQPSSFWGSRTIKLLFNTLP